MFSSPYNNISARKNSKAPSSQGLVNLIIHLAQILSQLAQQNFLLQITIIYLKYPISRGKNTMENSLRRYHSTIEVFNADTRQQKSHIRAALFTSENVVKVCYHALTIISCTNIQFDIAENFNLE